MEALAPVERALGLAAITLDGTALPLGTVAADVIIRHGRAGYFEGPSASTCQISIVAPPRSFVAAVAPGATLVVSHDGGGGTPAPRFTGKLTDGTLDDNLLTLVAVGIFSSVESKKVPNGPYPAQTWTQRLTWVFRTTDVNIPIVIGTPLDTFGDPPLRALTVVLDDEPNLQDWLDSMTGYMGASVADTTDGKLLIQPANSRTTANAVAIAPSDVLYTPEWRIVMPGYNDVWFDVGTSGQSHGVNSAAQAKYGKRRADFVTTIADAAYSLDLAQKMATRQGMPKWVLEGATLLSGHNFQIGQPLRLAGFTDSAPHSTWLAILEGWTDHIYSDGSVLRWTMDVALSDPALSGIGEQPIHWDEVAAELTWANMNQTVAWDQALDLDSLYP